MCDFPRFSVQLEANRPLLPLIPINLRSNGSREHASREHLISHITMEKVLISDCGQMRLIIVLLQLIISRLRSFWGTTSSWYLQDDKWLHGLIGPRSKILLMQGIAVENREWLDLQAIQTTTSSSQLQLSKIFLMMSSYDCSLALVEHELELQADNKGARAIKYYRSFTHLLS